MLHTILLVDTISISNTGYAIMKLLNALTQDVTVATKTQFDSVKLTKSHRVGVYVLTMVSTKEVSTVSLRKLVTEKLDKLNATQGVTLRVALKTGRIKNIATVELTVLDETLVDKDVNRIPLQSKEMTMSLSLKDHLAKYDVVVSDWKSNKNTGLIEVYGVKKTLAEKAVYVIADFYRQFGLVKKVTVNTSKNADDIVNIRIKPEDTAKN